MVFTTARASDRESWLIGIPKIGVWVLFLDSAEAGATSALVRKALGEKNR